MSKAPTPNPAPNPAPDQPAGHDASTPEGLHKLEAQRRANREAVRALGLEPYGVRVDGIISVAEARARFDEKANETFNAAGKTPPPGFVDPRPTARIAGRVMLHRDNGKLIWINLRDGTGDLQVPSSRTWGRGDRLGAADEDADGRDHDLGGRHPAREQEPGPPAGEVAGPARHGDPLPPALHGPVGQPRDDGRLQGALADRVAHPQAPGVARVSGGRDADAPGARGRGGGTAVRHAHERAGHQPLHAHRARALPQAALVGGMPGSSRSTATSATRASTSSTTPSSRCSRPTTPSATWRR
jgi:hypothetical protein